jgi:hypothetical protein
MPSTHNSAVCAIFATYSRTSFPRALFLFMGSAVTARPRCLTVRLAVSVGVRSRIGHLKYNIYIYISCSNATRVSDARVAAVGATALLSRSAPPAQLKSCSRTSEFTLWRRVDALDPQPCVCQCVHVLFTSLLFLSQNDTPFGYFICMLITSASAF